MKQRKGEAARAHWRGLVEAQAGSGQNVADFCRARGIPRTCFFAWRRKLAELPPPMAGFVEVGVRPAATAALLLELGGGRRIRVEEGFDAGLLRQLLEALES